MVRERKRVEPKFFLDESDFETEIALTRMTKYAALLENRCHTIAGELDHTCEVTDPFVEFARREIGITDSDMEVE